MSNPIRASPHIISLLASAHSLSLSQESKFPPGFFGTSTAAWTPSQHEFMKDKYVSLPPDKCHFIYSLLLSTGCTSIVEAGTSFGVSTVYLALAVGENAKNKNVKGVVIATEHESSKAEKAKQFWKECGKEIENVIELREGDLLETLKKDLPVVDCLLLDIWAPMALPTLKTVEKNFKRGSIIICDNTVVAATRYKDFLEYIRREDGPYRTMTLPYDGGLELSVYLP